MPDFTNCKRLLGNAYAGANGKKIGIEYQGEQYNKTQETSKIPLVKSILFQGKRIPPYVAVLLKQKPQHMVVDFRDSAL